MENVFDLLRGDVLSLTELEDVLLAVDEFESIALDDHADVSCVQPTSLVNRLLRLLWLLVVARDNRRPSDAHLPSWVWLISVVVV